MIDEQHIRDKQSEMEKLLREKRLKECYKLLSQLLETSSSWELKEQFEQDNMAYHYMLQYMKEGVEDPQREDMYQRLLTNAWSIVTKASLEQLDNVSSNSYHTLYKGNYTREKGYPLEKMLKKAEKYSDDLEVCSLMPDNKEQIDKIALEHDELMKYLFLSTWINRGWNTEEEMAAKMTLSSEKIEIMDLTIFINAVMLSLRECFDPNKFSFLMDALMHHEKKISELAMVNLVFVILAHPEQISLHKELMSRLSLYSEDKSFAESLNRIYLQLLTAQETEKVDKKMQEEILPEMMKNAHIMKNMRMGSEEMNEENDFNPDWEKELENSGFTEKIKEMNQLQIEGADVYMSSFKYMKNYPFFFQMHHWFSIFSMRHPTVIREFGIAGENEKSVLNMLLQSGFFCNSDKYSLLLMMTQIPQSQRDMMLSQMTDQDLSELMDSDKDSEIRKYSARPEIISNNYIHDLYRFYRLYTSRYEFKDPFAEKMELHRMPVLKPLLAKPGLMNKVAAFLLKKEHYEEALSIYREIIQLDDKTADTYQKAGYCLQKMKRYAEAAEMYRKADILQPDHIWTVRHLAASCRMMHRYSEALELYKKAESMKRGNKNLLFYIGSCLAELERYEEALQYFFQINLQDNSHIKSCRGIGWCSLMLNKLDQAEKYYEQVLAGSPITADHLNRGHIALIKGDSQRALKEYGSVVKELGKDIFTELLNKEKEILFSRGVKEGTLPILLDLIE